MTTTDHMTGVLEEVGEYITALRNDIRVCYPLEGTQPHKFNAKHYQVNYRGTVEEELADVAMRLLTWSVACNTWLDAWCVCHSKVVASVVGVVTESTVSIHPNRALARVRALAESHGIGLWEQVELKLLYNQTRGQDAVGRRF